MIEIYLFVNPLGDICLDIEKDILQFVENENKKIHFRFIPLLTMKTTNELLNRMNIPKNDIEKRNQLFQDLYSATLDYKAAQLQGKKKGRYVLTGLQQAVAKEQKPYSPELAEHLLVEAGGDLEMYRADRQSSFVKESFQTDQQIANEMGITKHPSAVVYNYSDERDYGILLEEFTSCQDVRQLCELSADVEPKVLNKFQLDCSSNTKSVKKQHLHLL